LAENSDGFEGWSHKTDESNTEWNQSELCPKFVLCPVLLIFCCEIVTFYAVVCISSSTVDKKMYSGM